MNQSDKGNKYLPVYSKADGTLTTKPQQEFVHSTYRGALAYSGYYQLKKPVAYLPINEPNQKEQS